MGPRRAFPAAAHFRQSQTVVEGSGLSQVLVSKHLNRLMLLALIGSGDGLMFRVLMGLDDGQH